MATVFRKVFVLFVIVGLCLGQKCPSECSCDTTTHRVTCDDASMKEIPDDIPTDTESLVIMGRPTKSYSISRLQRYKLKKLADLTELHLVYCGLRDVDADAFQDLKQLKLLDLRSNKITKIYQESFKGLDNLELINLSGNEDLVLQTGSVTNLPSLRDLYLSNLNLRDLHSSSFNGLDSLQHLDLSGNNLRRLGKDIFEPLKSLASLDITGNRFKGLNQELGRTLSKLQSLALGNNPWQCNCDIKWFKTLPIKFIYDSTAFSADRVVVCNGPSRLQYKNLKDLEDDQLSCIKPIIKDCKDLKRDVGTTATITCNITGDPFPDITWNVPDKSSIESVDDLDETKFEYSENGTLLIKSVGMPYNGIWKVIVENSRGQDEATFDFVVEDPFPPTISCQDFSEKAGLEVTLKCDIDGYPFPDIEWTQPDHSVIKSTHLDTSKFELKEKGKLVLKSLKKTEEGKWTVFVKNRKGENDDKFYVKVLPGGFAPTIENCQNVDEEEGQEGKIYCDIKGDPFPNITWKLPDDSEISTDSDLPDNFKVVKNGVLDVTTLEMTHDGLWKVLVRNEYGDDKAFLTVSVKKKKKKKEEEKEPDAAPPDWIIIGASAGGALAVISLIIIMVVCCKNKQNKVGDEEKG